MTLLLLLLSFALPVRADVWHASYPDAVTASTSRKQPILADFQAPWCYSCYYMEQKVLSKPAFLAAAKTLVPLKLDVDTPEGRALKEKHRVTFLPTYVVLAPGGDKELGRIVGEQTEEDFLKQLAAITAGKGGGEDPALEALREKAKKGDVKALETLLDKPADCKLPYAVDAAAPAVEKLYPEHRDAVYKKERKALESLDASKCADYRSAVETLADVYERQKDAAARSALLDKAIARLRSTGLAAGEDRNRDDNLRFFLEMKDDDAAVAEWYRKLLSAYPSDYVYAYRYAKRLHAKGRDADALPFIEKADKLAYGANRLNVTKVRAEILAKLGKKTDAVALLKRDAKAGAKAFPKEAADLEKTAAGLK